MAHSFCQPTLMWCGGVLFISLLCWMIDLRYFFFFPGIICVPIPTWIFASSTLSLHSAHFNLPWTCTLYTMIWTYLSWNLWLKRLIPNLQFIIHPCPSHVDQHYFIRKKVYTITPPVDSLWLLIQNYCKEERAYSEPWCNPTSTGRCSMSPLAVLTLILVPHTYL